MPIPKERFHEGLGLGLGNGLILTTSRTWQTAFFSPLIVIFVAFLVQPFARGGKAA